MTSATLASKFKLLNHIRRLAEKADIEMTEGLRKIALEISEQKFEEKEYIESQADLVAEIIRLGSAMLASRSEFARRFAKALGNEIETDRAKRKALRERSESLILSMNARELYNFFKRSSNVPKPL